MNNENYDLLYSLMWDMFNEANFVDWEEREEYLEELKLVSDTETVLIKIQELNNKIINPVTHIGRYNMSDLKKHLNKIL